MTAPQSRTPRNDPRYYDFDAAFAEAKPIPFKLLGKVWQLPPTVPAATILNIQRLMLALAKMDETGEVPDDLVIDDDLSYERMLREMVGEGIVTQWLELGISYDMLAAVTRRLYALHTGDNPDAQEPGKAARRPQDRKPPARKKASSRKR